MFRGPPASRLSIMSSAFVSARQELDRLLDERRHALYFGLGDNAAYMNDLDADVDAARAAYVGAAVTEIASVRAALSRPQVG
jgi:hypothetical protein